MNKKIKAGLITAGLVITVPSIVFGFIYCLGKHPEYILLFLATVLSVVGIINIYKIVYNNLNK